MDPIINCPGGQPYLTTGSAAPSDREVLAEVARLLRATRHFGEVVRVRADEVDAAVDKPGNRVVLVPSERFRLTREPGLGRMLRVVPYRIVVKLTHDRPAEAHARMDRLVGVVHNTLDGIPYTNYCLFEYCYLTEGRQDLSTPPTYLAGLTGQFAYVVDPATGYSEATP